jgi:hypothetical protein
MDPNQHQQMMNQVPQQQQQLPPPPVMNYGAPQALAPPQGLVAPQQQQGMSVAPPQVPQQQVQQQQVQQQQQVEMPPQAAAHDVGAPVPNAQDTGAPVDQTQQAADGGEDEASKKRKLDEAGLAAPVVDETPALKQRIAELEQKLAHAQAVPIIPRLALPSGHEIQVSIETTAGKKFSTSVPRSTLNIIKRVVTDAIDCEIDYRPRWCNVSK